MNKKFLPLVLLLLLVPACRKFPQYAPAPSISEQPASVSEKAEYDEELGAFVVKEDENKFSAAVAADANKEEELTAVGSEPTAGDAQNDSARYGLKNIFFEFNKYKIGDLRPDQRPVLQHDLEIVKSLAGKGYRISIEGHACNSAGSTEYNMMLSEDRARAVADYLKEHGIQGDISTVGHGSENRLVESGSREQQAPNRRVEIYAYPQDGAQ
jgi:outer membrane protein OmpA-like peptidoglycan-associated protein